MNKKACHRLAGNRHCRFPAGDCADGLFGRGPSAYFYRGATFSWNPLHWVFGCARKIRRPCTGKPVHAKSFARAGV
jgi:hypothetical protein